MFVFFLFCVGRSIDFGNGMEERYRMNELPACSFSSLSFPPLIVHSMIHALKCHPSDELLFQIAIIVDH